MIAVVALAVPAWSDEFGPPAPTGYSWAAWDWYVGERPYVEVFPPGSRNNPTDNPFAYFYVVPEPGKKFDLDARLVWSGPLVNKWMPSEVLVPRSGNGIVTLNDYGNVGYQNCVVIYDGHGQQLRSYAITDLYSAEVIKTIPATVSNREWNNPVRYTVSEDSRFLYIWATIANRQVGEPMAGKLHRVDLTTGELAIVQASEAETPKYYELRVFPYPLRFAALTDILKPKVKRTPRRRKLGTRRGALSANQRVSPSHSVVTALAQGGKRRAAGRAGYARR